jgi:hypothetical protein
VFAGPSAQLINSFMVFPGFDGDITIAFAPSAVVPALLYVGTATSSTAVSDD